MPKREYSGDSLDIRWQDLKDRPYKGKGETVDVTEGETGRVTTEGTDKVFGPSETAKRAYEIIPAFRQLDVEELDKFTIEWLEGDGDKARALAAIFALAHKSRRIDEFNKWISKWQNDEIQHETLVDVIGDIISDP